jgi:hypothetical protein
MRLRLGLLASLLVAATVVGIASAVVAAPQQNRGLTINATPNPVISGEGVLIYGELRGTDIAGQTIRLYHRVSPSRRFTLIGRTTTNPFGLYEFARAEGLVYTNRSWFVTGPGGSQSRTVHEHVAALISLHASRTTIDTAQPVLFYGHVTPNHQFERVFLQVQRGASDDWRTIDSGRLERGSNYAIVHRFRFPGERSVRTVLRGDGRNVRGASDPLTISVEQAQVPDFTIATSRPVIAVGRPATISGTLYVKRTKRPQPNTAVTLCSRSAGAPHFTCDTAGITDRHGNYGFTVIPVHTEVYVVRTTLAPHRHTALLVEGVRDVVTLTATPTSPPAGQNVTFSGSVTPEKAGDFIYLQRLGADGDYHTVGVSKVRFDSTYQFVRVFGRPGPRNLRVRTLGDPENVAGASAPVTVTVTPVPVGSLPGH